MKIHKVFNTIKNFANSTFQYGLAISIFFAILPLANAQVIDDITIKKTGKEAEINLHFITRIRYVRDVILKNGDIRIYVKLLNIDAKDPRLTWEVKDSPPSGIVMPFTITYPELDSSLTLSFGKTVEYRVSAGHDGQSISIFTPIVRQKTRSKTKSEIPVAVVPVPPVLPSVNVPSASVIAKSVSSPETPPDSESTDNSGNKIKTPEEIEQEAQQLFYTASEALQSSQIDKSVETLNKLLDLPPNSLSQAAQKMIGEAREKNGEFVKARAEYELYLKLYPKATDAKQVKARLATFPAEDAAKPVKGEPSIIVQKAREEKLQITGGISQNYYRGTSHTDSFATDGINPPTISTSDVTDQSQITTSLDLTARKRTENLDSRLVLREFNRINLLPDQPEDYRWNAVYIEQSARNRKFMYRLGRQSGAWGGLPGRFDGVASGYSINEKWRVNVATGLPVEYTSGGWDPGDRRTFTSVSVDLTRLPNEWSGSAYWFRQNVGGYTKSAGGILDRSSLGIETHFFEQRRNYMAMVEFDTVYKKLNLATFQGNWTRESGENYYMMLDHRRSPPLAFNMQGQYSQSVKEVTSTGIVSLKTLRDNAIALSSNSNMMSIGASLPYSSRLRFSTDFHLSNTGGTGETITAINPATTTVQPGTSGSGNQYAISFQAIGNNLLFENDLGIANATLSKNDTSKGQTFTFSQVNTFNTRWRVDMSLMLFNQNTDSGTHSTQIRPSITVNYRMNDAWNFTAEAGLEQYHTSNANSDDKTRRNYFYAGYRWDFR